jgi:hypothetical protein
MVLMTLTAGGIPKKYFDPLRREVLHTYGHENILTLSRLQEAGDTLVRQLACVAELHDKCHRQVPQQSIPVCSGLATPTFAEALLWLQACCGGRRAHAATFPPSGRASSMLTALRIVHAHAGCCAETAGTLVSLLGILHAAILHWTGKHCSCWWTATPMRPLTTLPTPTRGMLRSQCVWWSMRPRLAAAGHRYLSCLVDSITTKCVTRASNVTSMLGDQGKHASLVPGLHDQHSGRKCAFVFPVIMPVRLCATD